MGGFRYSQATLGYYAFVGFPQESAGSSRLVRGRKEGRVKAFKNKTFTAEPPISTKQEDKLIDKALGLFEEGLHKLAWVLYYPLAMLAYGYVLIYAAPFIALLIVMWRNIF